MEFVSECVVFAALQYSGRTICTISDTISEHVHAFLNIHMYLIIIHTSIFIARTLRTYLLSLLQTK
jgi:hypothetical protein